MRRGESANGADRPAAELEEERRSIAASEAALAESERLFRLTFEQAPVGAALVGSDFLFRRVNAAYCRMTGYTAEELAGMRFADLTHPDDIAVDVSQVRRLLAGELAEYAREKRFVRKDGSIGWLDVVVRPVLGDDGPPLSLLAMTNDITARREAEAALRASEARYRLLLQNQNDAVYVHETTPERPGAFVEVNDRACEMLGYSREELLGMEVEAIDVPEQAERLPAIMRRLYKTGGAVFATEHVAKDGRRVPVEVSTRLFDLHGHTTVLSIVRDVSERVAAEAAVAKAQQLLNETQEITKVGGWEYDVATRRFTWTDETYRIHGIEPGSDVNDINRNVAFYLPEDQPVIADAFRGILETGAPYDLELRFRSADGRELWVRTLARAEMKDGRVTRVVGNIMDITEQREAGEALRQSESQLARAEHMAHAGSWTLDVDRQEILVSKGWQEMHGCNRDRLPVADLLPIAHPDDRAAVEACFAQAVAERRPYDLEHRVLRQDDGEVRFLYSHGQPEVDEHGKVTRIHGAAIDITERKRSEEALLDSEQRFRGLFQESPVPVWEEDFSAVRERFTALAAQGVGDWPAYFAANPEEAQAIAALVRIVDVNHTSLDFFGVASKEQLVLELPQFFTEDSYPVFRAELAALAAGDTRFAAELPIVDLAGGRRTIYLHLNVVPGHEETLDRVLVSFVDVTEQRRAEEEVRRLNAELERRVTNRTEQRDALNRELEAFAYSISHDVRAPLRAIDGFSAMVTEDAGDRLSADDLEHLARVREAAQHMGQLIDDLLGLSRVARRDLLRTTVDVSALAADVAEELRREAPGRTVAVSIAPGMTANADPALLRIILYQFLSNAWKFTASHETALIEVGVTDRDGQSAFFVRDDGIGFDPRYAGHLFGVFQRLHQASEYPGDGIGLATVQRLVARHGGNVWAESTPDRGATFFFTLPDAAEPARGLTDGADA